MRACRLLLLALAWWCAVATAAAPPDGGAAGSAIAAPARAGTPAGAAASADAGALVGAGAPAGEADAPASTDSGRRGESRLVVFNRPVFTFRSAFLGVPPKDRANAAHARIFKQLEVGGEGRVAVELIPQGAVVKIDGGYAFVIAHGDIEAVAGESLDSATRAAVHALEQAIAATREARDARFIAHAVSWAAGATVIYVLALWLLQWLLRAVSRRLFRLADSTAGQIRIGGAEVLRRDRAVRWVRFVLRAAFWAIVLLVTYEWVGYVLRRFPFTRPWGDGLNAFLFETAIGIVNGLARAIPDLLVVVVIVALARGVNGLLGNFFDGVQARRVRVSWLDADSARPTRRLAKFGVWIFALVMAYPYIPGSDSEAFKGLSVLLGLMISIGGSGLVGQAASGLILMYTRTYRPGEYVRIVDQEGTIVEMGMFTTRLRTGLGEELTLPNSLVLGSVTKNYSRVEKGAGFVLDAAVTIGYDAPWRQVHAMLIEAARRTEGVFAAPAPHVYQTALSDFYVEYRLVCQAIQSEPRPRAEVLSNLHQNIQDVFNEHGVQIMSPHYLGDPAAAKVVPKDNWFAAPAVPPK